MLRRQMLLMISASFAASVYRVDGPVVLASDPSAAGGISTALDGARPSTEACLAPFESSTSAPEFVIHISRTGGAAPLVEIRAASQVQNGPLDCIRSLGKAVAASLNATDVEAWIGVVVPKTGVNGAAAITSVGGVNVVGGAGGDDVRTDGAPSIKGIMDAAVAVDTLRHNFDSIRDCYRRGLKRSFSLSGALTEKVAVGQDGTVFAATASTSTLNDTDMQNCIDSAFLTFRYPPLSRGSLVLVYYPLAFGPR